MKSTCWITAYSKWHGAIFLTISLFLCRSAVTVSYPLYFKPHPCYRILDFMAWWLSRPSGVQDKTHGSTSLCMWVCPSVTVSLCAILQLNGQLYYLWSHLYVWSGNWVIPEGEVWSTDATAGLSGFTGPVSTRWTVLLALLCCWTLLDCCQFVLKELVNMT